MSYRWSLGLTIPTTAPKPIIKVLVKPKPIPQPAPKPAPKPVPKPVLKPVPKPILMPVPKPVPKPAPMPAPKPAAIAVQRAAPVSAVVRTAAKAIVIPPVSLKPTVVSAAPIQTVSKSAGSTVSASARVPTAPTSPVAAVRAPALPLKAPAVSVPKSTEDKTMLTSTQAARLRALAAAKVTATAKPKGLLGKLTSALRPPVPKPGLRLGQRGLAPGLIKPRAIVQTAPGPVSSLAPATPPPPPEAATSSGGGGGGGGGGSWSPDPSSAPEFPPEEAPMEEPPAEEKPGGESVVDKVKSLPKWALYAGGAAVVYYLFFRRS